MIPVSAFLGWTARWLLGQHWTENILTPGIVQVQYHPPVSAPSHNEMFSIFILLWCGILNSLKWYGYHSLVLVFVSPFVVVNHASMIALHIFRFRCLMITIGWPPVSIVLPSQVQRSI
jgi:hypothetical protein